MKEKRKKSDQDHKKKKKEKAVFYSINVFQISQTDSRGKGGWPGFLLKWTFYYFAIVYLFVYLLSCFYF
jgi:hypothetical protein